ncbi:MAG: hypothetical protein ACXU86_12480 [Archangium sp.]
MKGRMRATYSLPGGTSGVLGNRHDVDLLPFWLTNDSFPLPTRWDEVLWSAESLTLFRPAR